MGAAEGDVFHACLNRSSVVGFRQYSGACVLVKVFVKGVCMLLMPVLSGVVGLGLILLMMFFLYKGTITRKEQHCPKDVWTTVIWNFGTGYPKDFRLDIESEKEASLAGEFREQKYFWIFPQTPRTGQLQPILNFHRDWINARYTVAIKPKTDVVVRIS